MKRYYRTHNSLLYYASPAAISFVAGLFSYVIAMLIHLMLYGYYEIAVTTQLLNAESKLMAGIEYLRTAVIIVGVMLWILAVILHFILPTQIKMKRMIQRGLFYYPLGNPLHLKEGELLPKVMVKDLGNGKYEVKIRVTAFSIDELTEISSAISSSLNSKDFDRYAVIQKSADVAMNWVKFSIEDVTVERKLTVTSCEELRTGTATKLIVQKNTYIDLTTSGSMLVAGKTRSGKSTGTICLLLQALQYGRDNFNSSIVIIDPKQAELSRLPHTVTLDEDGEATTILDALVEFEQNIRKRQKRLNELSEQKGDAVKWWDADMHVSLLFIDEYVSLRSIFPQKPSKDKPEYSLAAFDGLIKRIVTMGASSGSYVIISIAEASVSEGGLPAMLRSAMTTKILFKPTRPEARLMWDSSLLEDFPDRVYNAGEAWFSSTDGINDTVTYVKFPQMDFPVYRELGRLLKAYYDG